MRWFTRLALVLLCAAPLLATQTARASSHATKDDKEGGSTIVAAASGLCAGFGPSGLMLRTCSSTPHADDFLFTAKGQITQGCLCLEAGNGSVRLTGCDTSAKPISTQVWARVGNGNLVTQSTAVNACLTTRTVPAFGVLVDLEPCSNAASQNWVLAGVPRGWPVTPPNWPTKPTVDVPSRTLTTSQVSTIVDWIQSENSITSTPFCFKGKSYDRGVGIAPGCGDNQYKDGALCYSNCRSGFHPVGSVCWNNESKLSYNPGTHCTKRDKLGTCWHAVPNDCRDGYKSDGVATCWLKTPSYQNGVGQPAGTCNANRELQASLCYVTARSGYSCNATNCQAKCAKGSVDCGPAACAQDANQCAIAILNMTNSVLMVMANIATAGEAGEAKNAVMAAKNAYQAAQALDALQQLLVLENSIDQYMSMAESNLASLSTPAIADAVAAKYRKGSPNYRFITRSWAARQLLLFIADTTLKVDDLMITMIDPTQVSGVVAAFLQPICTDHKPIPAY